VAAWDFAISTSVIAAKALDEELKPGSGRFWAAQALSSVIL
jgi:hypothetical protein